MIDFRSLGTTALVSVSLFTLSACGTGAADDATGPHDHSTQHADHHGEDGHSVASAEPDDSTLADVMASKQGQSLPYYGTEDFTPIWLEPGSDEQISFHRVPEFEFVNQSGKAVSSESYDDTIYVATFFFATCPGICSPINNRLLTVQEAIADLDDVRILSHSITPEIDTVDVLGVYAAENKIDGQTWDLVTGDRDKLYAVAKQGYFASEDLGEGEAQGDFKHTENVLLIDRNGMIRGIYNGLSRNAMLDVLSDIELLRAEQPFGQS